MFKFKKKKAANSDNPQGISNRGNALQKYWRTTLLAILVPVIASFTLLLLLREIGIQQSQIQRITQTYANQQSASVELLFKQLQDRLQAAANSPLALSAITATDAVALIEKTMRDYFPGVTSLRLVPIGHMGTAEFGEGRLGLRNHIELGRSSLQQLYRKGNFTRKDEIASAGTESDYESQVQLNSELWTLVYTPSKILLQQTQISILPVVAVLGVTLLAVVAAPPFAVATSTARPKASAQWHANPPTVISLIPCSRRPA